MSDAVIVDLKAALNAPVTRVDLSFSFRTLHKNIDAFMELELEGAPRRIVTVHLKNGYFLYLQELEQGLDSTMLAEHYFADGRWHQAKSVILAFFYVHFPGRSAHQGRQHSDER